MSEENKADGMLVTGPGRFGKSLTMSAFQDFLVPDPENHGIDTISSFLSNALKTNFCSGMSG